MVTMNTIAAFDFDGTLTDRDSLLPFLFFTAGTSQTLGKLLMSLPVLAAFTLGLESRQATKEYVLTKFFKGLPENDLRALAQVFAAEELDKYVSKNGFKRIKWHLCQGHRCVLVSASLELYLRPWAEAKGFANVFASILQTDQDGNITGKLVGRNCWGIEKTRRLQEVLGPKENYVLYAYGDSQGDKELLALADHPYYRALA